MPQSQRYLDVSPWRWLVIGAGCALLDAASAGQSPVADAGIDPSLATIAQTPQQASPDQREDDRFRVDLDFHLMFGPVDGFLQTPSGGEPGTTDPNRPTLDEIGIDHASIYDAGLSLALDQHIITVGGQLIRLDGSATLARELLTQSTLFPAGSRVDSKVKLDWFRLGYQYEFRFDLPSGDQFRFAPAIQGVLLDFHYELDSPGLTVNRAYAKGGMQVGASAQWLSTGPFSLEASLYWGVPIENMVEIFSFQIIGKCQLWGDSQGNGGAAYLGLAFETIDYLDSQRIPNHVDVTIGPMLVAGVQIRF
jgi:hypothetical protein